MGPRRVETAQVGAGRTQFDEALVELRPRLHRYCARMTGSVIDGEDLVQEVALRAIAAFPAGGSIAHVEGWLFRIAHNVALNFLDRRNRERRMFSDEDPLMVADPAREIDSRDAAVARLSTFMHLPAAQRSSVVLKDVLGYSLGEVCQFTDSSLASVKANLHRGRVRLRQLVLEEDEAVLPVLSEPEKSRLKSYVDRFNARDFDGIIDLLTEDASLDLVNYANRKGRAGFDSYLGNYRKSDRWRIAVGFVDGNPAVIVLDPRDGSRGARNFMLLEWRNDMVKTVRDFAHAEYVLTDADIIIVE